MEGFGFEKLTLILVIVLVMFGAKRVPEIAASFGKGIREFKKGMSDLGKEAEAPPRALDRPAPSTPVDAGAATETPEPKRLLGQ
jgi:sec-independent protein translocase protein TatA